MHRFIVVPPQSFPARKPAQTGKYREEVQPSRRYDEPVNLGQPTERKPPFKFSAFTRVGFSDTDAQGIVYYGRYLPYFDDARVEYLRHLGLLHADLGACEFVMRASHVLYEAPARFDDLLEVFVRIRRIGRSSVASEYAAYRVDDDVLMCTAEQTHVLVDLAERRPHPIPDSYCEAVAAFEDADLELAVAS
jgi:acyl-CoA thioester hydrolase